MCYLSGALVLKLLTEHQSPKRCETLNHPDSTFEHSVKNERRLRGLIKCEP